MLKIACASAALALLMTAQPAWSAQCRATPAVINSAASIPANTAAGGHVSIHIAGNPTQADKSQFNTVADFNTAWTAWRQYGGPFTNGMPEPKNCGGGAGGLMDCVNAATLGIAAATVCDAVDAAGACTQRHDIVPVKVAFRYSKSNGLWILNTAYPSVNGDCQ